MTLLRSLLCCSPWLMACSSAVAQTAEQEQLNRYLESLRCELEYLPGQKAADGRPVARLLNLPCLGDDEAKNEFVEKRLDYIAKQVCVRSVSFNHKNFKHLLRCLERLPDLEDISTISYLTPEFFTQLKGLKTLRSLHLPEPRFGKYEDDPATFEKNFEKIQRECFVILGTMQQLRALDLSKSRPRDDDLKPLVNLKDLEELDLSYSEDLSDKGLKIVAEMAALKRLRLKGVGATDEGLGQLKSLTKLEQLHLAPLSPDQEAWLKKQERPCPKLTSKGLECLPEFTAMRDLSVEDIPLDPEQGLAFLRKMPKLESLALVGVELEFVKDVAEAKKKAKPDAPAYSDCSEFQNLKELRRLRLADTFFHEGTFERLPVLEKLETLQVARVGLDFKPLPQKMPNLKSLSLTHEILLDLDLEEVAKLRRLEYFAFNGRMLNHSTTLVTPEGLAKLKKANPKLVIFAVEKQLSRPR
jgi:hypothetical protein